MPPHLFPLITMLILYILAIYFIGFLASRLTKNLSDYVLGGRGLPAPIVALGAGASDMSGWLMLALPGAVYVSGLQVIWLPIGLATGAFLNWTFVAKRLRIYTEIAGDALTIPAYLKNRFQSQQSILGVVTAIIILIFFTTYTAAGFVSGALLLNTLFGIAYSHALLITATGIVLYLLLGGFLALSWIDFFQGTLIFFALLIVPAVTYFHLDNMQHLLSIVKHIPYAHTAGNTDLWLHHFANKHLSLMHNVSWIFIISMLGWGFGYFGQPHILVRFMAIKKPHKMKTARNICMVWMTLALVGATAIGFFGSLYYHHLAKPDTIMLHLAIHFFNPWVAGFVMSAVLSAIMSATSAQLLVTASALSEDFYHRLRPKAKQKELLMAGRIAVIIVAIIAYIAASSPKTSLLQIVSYAWSGMGAAFGPIVLLSLFWPRCTQLGAIVGMIVGTVTVIIWHFLGNHVGGIFSLYEIVPGFILAFISIVVVSLCDKKPNQAVIQQWNKYTQHLKQKEITC